MVREKKYCTSRKEKGSSSIAASSKKKGNCESIDRKLLQHTNGTEICAEKMNKKNLSI
jgi:hypothetical protein